jgi:hypothetical protein
MELVFHCVDGGRRLYSVERQGRSIFVGSEDECRRFLALHRSKVREEHEDERRPHRLPPPRPRVYRVAAPRAS